MGYSGEAMLAGVSGLIARVLVAFVLVGRIGFNGVCCANPAAWVFADVVLLVLYFREMRHIRSAQTGVQPEVAQTKIIGSSLPHTPVAEEGGRQLLSFTLHKRNSPGRF